MPIVRQSIVHPQPGRKRQVEDILDRLEAHYATFTGYILGFRYKHLAADHDANEVGRIALWRSHEDADHASRDPRPGATV